MSYSIEKFPNGGCVIFGHYSFGVVPLMSLINEVEYTKFVNLLIENKTSTVPDDFKKAFGENV